MVWLSLISVAWWRHACEALAASFYEYWAISLQRKSKQGRRRLGSGCIYLKPTAIFIFVTLTLENKLSPRGILLNCVKPLGENSKAKNQERLMEIPHEFFVNTFRNSTSFSIDPGISMCLFFLQYHFWKFHVFNPRVTYLDFSWDNPLLLVTNGYWPWATVHSAAFFI